MVNNITKHHCPYCRHILSLKIKNIKTNICINLKPSEWLNPCTVDNFEKLKVNEISNIKVNDLMSINLISYKENNIFLYHLNYIILILII